MLETYIIHRRVNAVQLIGKMVVLPDIGQKVIHAKRQTKGTLSKLLVTTATVTELLLSACAPLLDRPAILHPTAQGAYDAGRSDSFVPSPEFDQEFFDHVKAGTVQIFFEFKKPVQLKVPTESGKQIITLTNSLLTGNVIKVEDDRYFISTSGGHEKYFGINMFGENGSNISSVRFDQPGISGSKIEIKNFVLAMDSEHDQAVIAFRSPSVNLPYQAITYRDGHEQPPAENNLFTYEFPVSYAFETDTHPGYDAFIGHPVTLKSDAFLDSLNSTDDRIVDDYAVYGFTDDGGSGAGIFIHDPKDNNPLMIAILYAGYQNNFGDPIAGVVKLHLTPLIDQARLRLESRLP